MKIGYIAGRFTGAHGWDIAQNVRRAEEVGYAVALLGAMPLIPHANTANFHGTLRAEFWYKGTLELLRRCDFIVLVPGYQHSLGAKAERDEAVLLGKPVFKAFESGGEGQWYIAADSGLVLSAWLEKEST